MLSTTLAASVREPRRGLLAGTARKVLANGGGRQVGGAARGEGVAESTYADGAEDAGERATRLPRRPRSECL